MSKQHLKFVDYLVSNMPATALGKGHPVKCLYAIPDNIYKILYDHVEDFNLEETSSAFIELRDNVTPGRVTSLPMNDFLSNLCTNDGKIYPFDEINWLQTPNEWKPPVNKPSNAELNKAKLTFVDYLVQKIPTVEIYQASGTVLGIPIANLNIIKELVEEYNVESLAYKNLCNRIESSKIVCLEEVTFMTRLYTQEIKPISEGIETPVKLVPDIADLIDKSVILNMDTGVGEISKAKFNLIHKILGESNLESLEFEALSNQVVAGQVKMLPDEVKLAAEVDSDSADQ